LQVVGWRRYFDAGRIAAHPAADGVRLMVFPAGHIPGAAMILVEVDRGDQRPFRLLYTGDFCAHDQPLVEGALFPKTGESFPIDVLVMEGVLATNEEADRADYGAELRRCVREVRDHNGATLIGVSTLGEAAPVLKALADAGSRPVVHRALEPVLQAVWPGWSDASMSVVDEAEARRAFEAKRIVVAPGDQFEENSPAGRLVASAAARPDGLIVVLNRAHKGTVAGQLCAADRRANVDIGARQIRLEARVERFLLVNHAPRGQLVAAARAVDPDRLVLVHGKRSRLFALGRAIDKAGFGGQIDVPETGERLDLA
ncbi:MAG: MBL fold metallo-hydrolase RNA specificity domain-containing protein, partial [Persicimonas sp.]